MQGYDFKDAKDYEGFELSPCRGDRGWDVLGFPGFVELAHEDRLKDAKKILAFYEAYRAALTEAE